MTKLDICWICGGYADTREHLIKASDLRSNFGKISQSTPLFFHSVAKRNTPVGSFKSDRFKLNAKICVACNSSLTQPYDMAWEKLSTYLRENFVRLNRANKIDLSKVFPGATSRAMLNVHLYFIKIFGCLIVEHQIPINVSLFAECLKSGKPHPNLHLAFGPRLGRTKHNYAGVTAIEAVNKNGITVFATWFYMVGDIAVNIIYAIDEEFMKTVRINWHPRSTQKILRMSHFINNKRF